FSGLSPRRQREKPGAFSLIACRATADKYGPSSLVCQACKHHILWIYFRSLARCAVFEQRHTAATAQRVPLLSRQVGGVTWSPPPGCSGGAEWQGVAPPPAPRG